MQFVWGLLLKFYYSVFPQMCCRMDQLKENCEAVCIKCFDTVSWSSENSYNSDQLSSILLNCDLAGLEKCETVLSAWVLLTVIFQRTWYFCALCLVIEGMSVNRESLNTLETGTMLVVAWENGLKIGSDARPESTSSRRHPAVEDETFFHLPLYSPVFITCFQF